MREPTKLERPILRLKSTLNSMPAYKLVVKH